MFRYIALLLISFAQAHAGERTLPWPPELVQQTVIAAIRNMPARAETQRRYHTVYLFATALFPGDADFAMQTGKAHGAAISRWLALPASQRRNDLMIYPDVDYFWSAEGGRYQCNFLVRLTATDNQSTRIELIQLQPTIYAGKSFHLMGRTGPGRYMDLRPAQPSVQTEMEFFHWLSAILPAQRQ